MSRRSPTGESRVPFADLAEVRSQFPCLQQQIHGKQLIYLDSAATSQKPSQVIEAVDSYYREYCSNVHRGVHTLSERATSRYEGVRPKVAVLINAPDPHSVIFTRSTTEGINLVARTIGRSRVGKGDEVLISAMEHHANIVPWQMLCEEQGAILRVIPCDENGDLILNDLESLITDRTKVVSVGYVSNAVGTRHDVKKIISAARNMGAITLIDAAQAISHIPVDVEDLGCDFLAFSGHKMYGPTGIGVLWGRKELLDQMSPWQGGGDMIRTVSFERTTYADTPWKFEAGTPNIAGVQEHESHLVAEAMARLDQVEGLSIIGRPSHRISVISFILDGIHPHDAGTIIDQHSVAIRAGHHCAMPLMKHFGVPATIRASFAVYNTHDEIEALTSAIESVKAVFR